MSKKNLLIGIVSVLAIFSFAGAALAGEGDYPPLSTYVTSSAGVSSHSKDAADCGRTPTQQKLTVEECLSKCS